VIGFGARVLDRGRTQVPELARDARCSARAASCYGLFEGSRRDAPARHALVVEGLHGRGRRWRSRGIGNAVATLGTACTAEHLQKLFRFTDSVVFSFDGDKAGRRAAARALEASLPHATDTRTIRFLFLPPEHDPDSYVREFGPEAFQQRIDEAVPLSRQLAELAGEGNDLDTAEGRAHMLATAKPLWSAMPSGALKRQLLAQFTQLGHLEAGELAAMWEGAGTVPRAPAAPAAAPASAGASRARARRTCSTAPSGC
jgi:DNA primase